MTVTFWTGHGMPCLWDDNGNLLHDGVNTYTYDSANRLKTMTGPSVDASYAYRCNGESIGQFGCESDRVSQTVNGVTTNYVLDSASPLTQVLQDGTKTYVYGVDRIAQMNGTVPEYFLTDGLGSVRQLVDSNGAVILAKSYQPYGTETSSVGSGLSSYGFTGEMTDPTGFIYLRARYLAPNDGRFLTKDTWMGDYYRPLSLNRWNYVEGNPVNFIDPSGHYPILGDHNWSFMTQVNNPIIGNNNSTSYECNTIPSKPPCYEWRWIEKEVDVFTFPFGATKEKIIVPQLVPCRSTQIPPTALFEKKTSEDDETCAQFKQLFEDVIDEQAHAIRVLGQYYDSMLSSYSDEQYYVYLTQYWAELVTLSTLETLAAQIRASARARGCDVSKWANPKAKRIPPAPPLPPSKRPPKGSRWN